jgi:transcriptional regulator of acetoin/glycerol metabolism
MISSESLEAEITGEYQTIPAIRERHAHEERWLILTVLVDHAWNATHAARALGISRNGIRKLIRRHGLTELHDAHKPGAGRPYATRPVIGPGSPPLPRG